MSMPIRHAMLLPRPRLIRPIGVSVQRLSCAQISFSTRIGVAIPHTGTPRRRETEMIGTNREEISCRAETVSSGRLLGRCSDVVVRLSALLVHPVDVTPGQYEAPGFRVARPWRFVQSGRSPRRTGSVPSPDRVEAERHARHGAWRGKPSEPPPLAFERDRSHRPPPNVKPRSPRPVRPRRLVGSRYEYAFAGDAACRFRPAWRSGTAWFPPKQLQIRPNPPQAVAQAIGRHGQYQRKRFNLARMRAARMRAPGVGTTRAAGRDKLCGGFMTLTISGTTNVGVTLLSGNGGQVTVTPSGT